MNKKLQFSKSSDFYFNTKKDFFDNNFSLLQEAIKVNQIYLKQPKRTNCKICHSKLPQKKDISIFSISYVLCTNCGHFNGTHVDTLDFHKAVYVDNSGEAYSKDYISNTYSKRTREIYLPKLQFLIENLREDFSILDIGCGAGFFVNAALDNGIRAEGIDVNKILVEIGNNEINNRYRIEPLSHLDISDYQAKIQNTTATVITAIGVIEHLMEPLLFFEAFKRSEAKYLYYSVPLLSLSAIFQNSFPSVFPRHLSGAHTHLFTETSITRMHEILNVVSIAEWRFGTDIVDMFRSISIDLKHKKASNKFIEIWESKMYPVLDSLQSILDQAFFTSEIHCLVKKI